LHRKRRRKCLAKSGEEGRKGSPPSYEGRGSLKIMEERAAVDTEVEGVVSHA